MRIRLSIALLAGLLMLGACQRETEAPPAPFAMTQDAMGRYCGMMRSRRAVAGSAEVAAPEIIAPSPTSAARCDPTAWS